MPAAMASKPVILRNPHSTRPYQHVLEPLFAYLMIAAAQYQQPELAGWYNVGPDDCDCLTTGQLTELFCNTWGRGMSWINQSDNGPHEANFLKLDCSKLKQVFGWQPRWHIQEAMEMIIAWYDVYLQHGSIAAEMDREISLFAGDKAQ